MKVAIGGFLHELNSFVSQKTDLKYIQQHELSFGENVIYFHRGKRTQIGGSIKVADKEKVQLIPILYGHAGQWGLVTSDCYKYLKEYFIQELRKIGKLDGILLVLHGAMVTENLEDPEGDFVAAIRKEVGDSIPIVANFDLHGNITKKIVDNLDALIAQKTYPHEDNFEIGEESANCIISLIRKKIKPVIAFKKLPMLVPMVNVQTTHGPMKDIIERAKEMEKEDKIINVSIFGVQPWMDIKDVGWSIVVTTDNDITLANEKVNELANLAWKARKIFNQVNEYTIEEAITRSTNIEGGPIIFVESADTASQDSPLVLKVLLEKNFQYPAALVINDCSAVEKCIQAGIGKEIKLEVGGKICKKFYEPLAVHARIKLISDGRYIYRGPLRRGLEVKMGKTVVLTINNNINLVVTSHRCSTHGPENYRSVGIDPQQMKIVLVKAINTFRPGWRQEIVKEIILLKTLGPSSSDLLSLPFKNIKRPMYPWDQMDDYKI